jgi:hypothetical protein
LSLVLVHLSITGRRQLLMQMTKDQ